ncbi:copper transporter [Antribacter sp. KLBMP9083]|uniref:Copper transporter n=1 Tax=Antribacter soli TaxID=2910976 RepID=A0AA41UBX1_9MICO|nr:copper transporter [Antribacter soli]MCF4121529.1 copper transporter [Antribacter soli]
MIDFRYHLVSLISVFLALAVGIILGAGPLQGTIGEALEDQVAQLRDERSALRDDLDAANRDLAEDLRFLEATGPQLLAGRLEGRRVAVVGLGDVSGEVHDGVLEQLDASGATVVADVNLPASWYDPEDASTRETVATGLRDGLGSDVPEGVTETLAAALGVMLTDAADAGPAQSAQAQDLEDQLVRLGLLDADEDQLEAADAVVLLAATAVEPEAAEGTTTDTETESDVWTTVAGTVQDTTGASVVAGPADVAADVVLRVRADDALASVVSTVSGIDRVAGRITVPLAIAARLAGTVGQYGQEEDATVLPPVVDLPPDEVPDATEGSAG